jgi:hypothetical protein
LAQRRGWRTVLDYAAGASPGNLRVAWGIAGALWGFDGRNAHDAGGGRCDSCIDSMGGAPFTQAVAANQWDLAGTPRYIVNSTPPGTVAQRLVKPLDQWQQNLLLGPTARFSFVARYYSAIDLTLRLTIAASDITGAPGVQNGVWLRQGISNALSVSNFVAGVATTASTAAQATANGWHTMGVSILGAALTFYFDGVAVGTETRTSFPSSAPLAVIGNPSGTAAQNCSLGTRGGLGWCYRGALTAVQQASLHAQWSAIY